MQESKRQVIKVFFFLLCKKTMRQHLSSLSSSLHSDKSSQSCKNDMHHVNGKEKLIRYRGANSVSVKIVLSLLKRSLLYRKKICILWWVGEGEANPFLISSIPFRRGFMCSKANRQSQKLSIVAENDDIYTKSICSP